MKITKNNELRVTPHWQSKLRVSSYLIHHSSFVIRYLLFFFFFPTLWESSPRIYFGGTGGSCFAQLVIDNTTYTPQQLVQNVFLGGGVTVFNVTYDSSSLARGYFNGTNSNIGLAEGVILATGNIFNAVGPNNSPNKSTSFGFFNSDVDLEQFPQVDTTKDVARLEFDFIPISDTIRFRYVFASEEYHEIVNNIFNDAFGFFISGPGISGPYSNNAKNIALIPGTTTPVSINNVNAGYIAANSNAWPGTSPSNSSYFIANGNGNGTGNVPNNVDGTTIQYDGFTTVLEAVAVVIPCSTYHIKLVIADVSDFMYDSGVFLEAKSFSSNAYTAYVNPDSVVIENCSQTYITFMQSITSSSPTVIGYTIGGTATNGVDYTLINDTIIIPANEDSANLLINPIFDGIPEGVETISIVYTSGCLTDTVTVYILDNNSLVADAGNDVFICTGSSTVLSASASGGQAPYTYSWSPATGLNNTSIPNPTASPATTTTYTVTITDACGATDSDNVTVTVGQITANAGNDVAICQGSSTTLNATGGGIGATYSWSPATGLSNPNIPNPVASPSSTTTYTVTITDGGCSDTDDVTVTVNSNPTANAGTDITICAGNTLSLTGAPNGLTSYSWTGPNSFSSNQQSPTVSTNATTAMSGTYTLTVTNANGCTDNDDVNVTVNSLPTANAGTDITICEGSILSLTGSPNGMTSYSWTGPNSFSSNQQNPTVSTNATLAMSGTYTLTVTNANGCTDNDDVIVTVNSNPTANAGTDISVCEGNTLALTGNPNGMTNYLWTGPNNFSSNQQSPTVSTNATLAMSGTYTLTVTNANGCTDSDDVNVTVGQIVANAGNDISICEGSTLSLTGLPNGMTSYSWTGPNNFSSNQQSPTVSTNATLAMSGIYTLTITQGNCSDSDEVTVTVNSNPTANAGTDITICEASTLSLTGSPNGMTSYSWTGPNSFSSNQQSPTVSTNATTAMSGIYTLTVTDANGCTDSDDVNIIVNFSPTANAGPNISICEGNTLSLTGAPNGMTTYSWTGPNSFTSNLQNPTVSTNATIAMSGTYTLTVTNANGCTDSDDVNVTVNSLPTANAGNDITVCEGNILSLTGAPNGMASYSWTGPNSYSSTLQSPTVSTNATIAMSGIYTLTVTDANGCTDSDDVTVTVNPSPTADAGSDVTICEGDNTQLSASASGGTPPYTYNWSPPTGLDNPNSQTPMANPTTTTTYTVTVTDANGCTDTDAVTVNVSDVTATIANPTPSICLGESITLPVSATGGVAPYTYDWTPGTGLSDSTISSPIASPTDTTSPITYTVIVSDAAGCSDTASVTVTVNPLPTATATTTDNVICYGESTTLQATGGISYVWTPPWNLNNPIAQNPTATPSITTIYTVTVTDLNGCEDTDTVMITVNPLPQVNACCNATIDEGECVGLTVITGNAIYYNWSPANGLDSVNIPSPTACPTSTTTYTIQVTDINGCVNTDAVIITVIPETSKYNIDVPTAFSPNGDNFNDILYVKQYGNCVAEMDFMIFNRHGQMVFHTKNINEGWDGKFMGIPQECDVYVYYLKAKFIDGRDVEKKGNITLLR